MRKLLIRFQNWLNSDTLLLQQISLLEKWVESEKQEKEFYRNLLLTKFGITQEERKNFDEQSEIMAQSVRPRTWHHARRALELRDRQKYWEEKIAASKKEETV